MKQLFKMHFYRFLLGFSKGSSIPPICQGAQETEYTLRFEENEPLFMGRERASNVALSCFEVEYPISLTGRITANFFSFQVLKMDATIVW